VLLNLFNNAVDAILDRHGVSGGTLKVSARQSGRRVIIQVSDNGVGIDPADMDRIFTPFFTTKPVGKGTGLGLSVCYGLIHQMEGEMEASSQKGVGTTFTIELPSAGCPSVCDGVA
jgi:two-component system, NtrC family, sensor kinase